MRVLKFGLKMVQWTLALMLTLVASALVQSVLVRADGYPNPNLNPKTGCCTRNGNWFCANDREFLDQVCATKELSDLYTLAYSHVRRGNDQIHAFVSGVTHLPEVANFWDDSWLHRFRKCALAKLDDDVVQCVLAVEPASEDELKGFSEQSEMRIAFRDLRWKLASYVDSMLKAYVIGGLILEDGRAANPSYELDNEFKQLFNATIDYTHHTLPRVSPRLASEGTHGGGAGAAAEKPVAAPNETAKPTAKSEPKPESPGDEAKPSAEKPRAARKQTCAKTTEESIAKNLPLCKGAKPTCSHDVSEAVELGLDICSSTAATCTRDPAKVTDQLPMCTTDETGPNPGAALFGDAAHDKATGYAPPLCSPENLATAQTIASSDRYGGKEKTDANDRCPMISAAQATLFQCHIQEHRSKDVRAVFAGRLAQRIADLGIELNAVAVGNFIDQIAACGTGDTENSEAIKKLHATVFGIRADIAKLKEFDTSAELAALEISVGGVLAIKTCNELKRLNENGLRRMYSRSLSSWFHRIAEKESEGLSKDTTQTGVGGLPPALLRPCADDNRYKPEGI